MSVFKMCPHNNQECIHEIYAGEPNYKWCKKCAFYTTTDIFLDKVMRRQGDSGILDLAKMARHKKL